LLYNRSKGIKEDQHMLVLSRKVGQRIRIGEEVTITVVRITGGGVRLGIEAPADLSVIREELLAELERADKDRPIVFSESDGLPADSLRPGDCDE
jgi:carbon storage regulator